MPLDPLNGEGQPTARVDRRPRHGDRGLGRAFPGRVFVLAAALALLALWGVLYLGFVAWRSGVRERIAFGSQRVATVLRPMAGISPPGIAVDDWRAAVDDSGAMLQEVVGTGRLDRSQLESLRDDLSRRVDQAIQVPESAPNILATIWDDMARLKRFREQTRRPDVLLPPHRDRGADPGPTGATP